MPQDDLVREIHGGVLRGEALEYEVVHGGLIGLVWWEIRFKRGPDVPAYWREGRKDPGDHPASEACFNVTC